MPLLRCGAMKQFPQIIRYFISIAAVLMLIAPQLIGLSQQTVSQAQSQYPYAPRVGDSWVYEYGEVDEEGSFSKTATIILNITSESGGIYTMAERHRSEILEGFESEIIYRLLSNWSIIDLKNPGFSIDIDYRPPIPYVYHPRSASDRFSINSTLTIRVETPNGTVTLKGVQSLKYIVNGTTWIIYGERRIQAYIVRFYSETVIVDNEQNVISNTSEWGGYIINNSFKLPFIIESIQETGTVKMILQDYTLSPDPLSTPGQTTQTTRTTTTVTQTTPTATQTTQTVQTITTITTTTQTTIPATDQTYTLLLTITRMGNYTGPDIPIRIRIQNLVSGQTIAEVGVNRTYSIRLPSSTYIISIENLEGRSSDGYTYYRFMEWRISEDSSTRVSRDPSIRISINRDTVITIILEIYTLQAQPKTTTTQPGTTSANTTTPIAGGTTRSPGDTRPQITIQPQPPLQGGGETGAPEPVIGTQQQPWYSSPVIIGSIAGGATAITALLVIRRRMLKRPIISDEGPSIRGRGGTGSPSYPSQPQQLPPSPQPSSTTSPMTGGVVAGQSSTHSGSKICPSCGASNPVSAKFCKQCGTQLPSLPSAEAEGMMCPYCGASVKRGARFCPRCGSSL